MAANTRRPPVLRRSRRKLGSAGVANSSGSGESFQESRNSSGGSRTSLPPECIDLGEACANRDTAVISSESQARTSYDKTCGGTSSECIPGASHHRIQAGDEELRTCNNIHAGEKEASESQQGISGERSVHEACKNTQVGAFNETPVPGNCAKIKTRASNHKPVPGDTKIQSGSSSDKTVTDTCVKSQSEPSKDKTVPDTCTKSQTGSHIETTLPEACTKRQSGASSHKLQLGSSKKSQDRAVSVRPVTRASIKTPTGSTKDKPVLGTPTRNQIGTTTKCQTEGYSLSVLPDNEEPGNCSNIQGGDIDRQVPETSCTEQEGFCERVKPNIPTESLSLRTDEPGISSREKAAQGVEEPGTSTVRQVRLHEDVTSEMTVRDHRVRCCSKQLLEEVLSMYSEFSKELLGGQELLSPGKIEQEHRTNAWDFETAIQENITINGVRWHDAVETENEPDIKILEDQLDELIVNTTKRRKKYPRKILGHFVKMLKMDRETLGQHKPVVKPQLLKLQPEHEARMLDLNATATSISKQISDTMKALPTQIAKAEQFSQVLSLQPTLESSRTHKEIFCSKVRLEDLARRLPKPVENPSTENSSESTPMPVLRPKRQRSQSPVSSLYPLHSKRKTKYQEVVK
ncbi:kinetochore-associated protein NSL1 homolog [Bombina bombina]|uniref:kinetochore-associated protein NSL1 homolog n=1 Tax=Bombina bombina TaxID=8345 RepID=UPI00235A589A|nr:kinetochore-associated protein NSL1 homolog [Bombina bombina]